MDYTVHGILQARILEWVSFPFSRVSSQHRDPTHVSHITGGYLPAELSEKLILLCLAIIYYIILMYNLLYHNQLDLV